MRNIKPKIEICHLLHTNCSNNFGARNVIVDVSTLDENRSFKMLEEKITFKTALKNIGNLICSLIFLSPQVVTYLYRFTIRPCMEYWHYDCVSITNCYSCFFDRKQKQIFRADGFRLAALPWILSKMLKCDLLELVFRLILWKIFIWIGSSS